MERKLAIIGLFLFILALLSAIAGFQADGWTFQAFDTGQSPYWQHCSLLCPLGLVLIMLALGAARESYGR